MRLPWSHMQMLGQMTAIRIKNPSGDPKGLKNKQLEIMDVSYSWLYSPSCNAIYTIYPYDLYDIRFIRMIYTISPALGVLCFSHSCPPFKMTSSAFFNHF